MFAAKKIVKEKDAQPEPFEMDVAQALCDLEANSNDLKAELRELYIVAAKEVDVTGRKAVVIFVPFKLLKVVHKIQSRLVREVRLSLRVLPCMQAAPVSCQTLQGCISELRLGADRDPVLCPMTPQRPGSRLRCRARARRCRRWRPGPERARGSCASGDHNCGSGIVPKGESWPHFPFIRLVAA